MWWPPLRACHIQNQLLWRAIFSNEVCGWHVKISCSASRPLSSLSFSLFYLSHSYFCLFVCFFLIFIFTTVIIATFSKKMHWNNTIKYHTNCRSQKKVRSWHHILANESQNSPLTKNRRQILLEKRQFYFRVQQPKWKWSYLVICTLKNILFPLNYLTKF